MKGRSENGATPNSLPMPSGSNLPSWQALQVWITSKPSATYNSSGLPLNVSRAIALPQAIQKASTSLTSRFFFLLHPAIRASFGFGTGSNETRQEPDSGLMFSWLSPEIKLAGVVGWPRWFGLTMPD
jgi:hypothetical protein